MVRSARKPIGLPRFLVDWGCEAGVDAVYVIGVIVLFAVVSVVQRAVEKL